VPHQTTAAKVAIARRRDTIIAAHDNVRQHPVTMVKGMLVGKVSRGLYVAVKPAA
jgi:hypothetical protein